MDDDGGFWVFDTAIGWCGIAWGDGGIVGVQLPLRDQAATADCMRRRFPQLSQTAPVPEVASVMARVQRLLQGEHDALLDVRLDMSGIPEFQQRVYAITRAIPPGSQRHQ